LECPAGLSGGGVGLGLGLRLGLGHLDRTRAPPDGNRRTKDTGHRTQDTEHSGSVVNSRLPKVATISRHKVWSLFYFPIYFL